MSLDLTRYPVTLPGQPAGSRLTLADIHRFCVKSSSEPEDCGAKADRPLTALERAAIIKLAYQGHGVQTVASLTLDEMLRAAKVLVCPLTLEQSTDLRRAYSLYHGDWQCSEAPPLDTWAQFLGLLPYDLWGREHEKDRLWNMVPMSRKPSYSLLYGHGAFRPTVRQLVKLIVETEARLASAISSAEPDGTWSLDARFGASTALFSIETGEASSSSSKATTVAHAHEYDWVAFPHNMGPIVINASAQDSAQRTRHANIEFNQALTKFRPPLPSVASFLAPAAATAAFVHRAHKRRLRRDTDSEETYWSLAVYFCKLLSSITSGRTFATVLATRPRGEAFLPPLDPEVQSCLLEHGTDDRHRRAFPTFGTDPQRERKRKRPPPDEAAGGVPRPEDVRVFEVTRVSRTPGESHGDDVIYSWRAARAGSRAEAQCEEEVLKSAVWHYETALNNHTRAVLQAYDGGRGGVDLFQLLFDWPAFYAAVGEEKAEELQRLRDELKEAQENVRTWLKKVVDRRSHEEAVVAA